MDVNRIQHVLTSLMILSFLIFGGLSAIILITNVPLSNGAVALPFAFLFISMMTLVVTTQIKDNPNRINMYIREWLSICVFVIIISALTFTFSG